MYRPNKYQTYQANAVFTASPAQLVLMLFDGAIKFLHIALEGFKHTDPLDFNLSIHQNTQKAQAIIRELKACLDPDKGPEFSEKMSALYDYFDRRLQQGNLKKEREPLEEVSRHLHVLREAWREMIDKQNLTQSVTAPQPERVGEWSATG
ncbi:MAG: flagellar export chaperone FliS [Verrucomicrobia bacterium]|nr:flagellar export chaperone FliS [Verrucomicrobiota bacterium]